MKQAFEASNENIQLLADRLEISNLLLDLAAAIDTNDRAALQHIFAANVTNEESLFHTASDQHQITSADIHIDADTAVARTLCHNAEQALTQAVYYVYKLQRMEEGWRILARTMHMERS